MDELVDELKKRVGLSDAQAKATARVVAEWLKHDDKRKKLIAAATASLVASGVV
jgi:hypothetical protein